MSPSPFDLLRQMIRDGQACEPFARRLAIQCIARVADPLGRALFHYRLEEALQIAELGGIMEAPVFVVEDAMSVVDAIERAAR